MTEANVQAFLAANHDCFAPEQIFNVKSSLEKMDDSKLPIIQSITFRSTTLVILLAVLVPFLDNFFVGKPAAGIFKILTAYGLGIWWIVDMCTAKKRTYTYNYKKFLSIAY